FCSVNLVSLAIDLLKMEAVNQVVINGGTPEQIYKQRSRRPDAEEAGSDAAQAAQLSRSSTCDCSQQGGTGTGVLRWHDARRRFVSNGNQEHDDNTGDRPTCEYPENGPTMRPQRRGIPDPVRSFSPGDHRRILCLGLYCR